MRSGNPFPVIAALCFCVLFSLPGYGAIPPVDLDYDGDVDGSDLGVFVKNLSQGLPGSDLGRFAAALGLVEDFDHVYNVGPGQAYGDPSQVPWESLMPGSLVRIHFRMLPYAHKWVIAVAGTPGSPIVVRGIPKNGVLPVITGENAVTRQELDFWNENRSVIKIGGSSNPSQIPSHIVIENLDIRSARPPYTFTDDRGNLKPYSKTASCIHGETGENITIRNCILQDSGNGFFSSAQTSDLVIEGNHIHGNGIENSIFHHNNYTESLGIIFQYNRFGPLRSGCRGNNLKDRSAGTIVRYNWIEAGNRCLDLVDSDHARLINDPSYRATHVYGNILIKGDVVENSQVLHYGGDSGDLTRYRQGTLWFFNNTVVSYRSGNTTLMRLSSNGEHAKVFNNILFTSAPSGRLAMLDAQGVMALHHNWLTRGWVDSHSGLTGTITGWANLEGTSPGFMNMADQNFHPAASSPCRDQADAIPSDILPAHDLGLEYVRHALFQDRPRDGKTDMGAFEWE